MVWPIGARMRTRSVATVRRASGAVPPGRSAPESRAPGTAKQMVGGRLENDAKLAEVVQGAAELTEGQVMVVVRSRRR